MIRDPVVIVSYVSLVQDRSTEMSAMTHFTRTVTTNYSLIMDANKNPCIGAFYKLTIVDGQNRTSAMTAT